MSAAGPIRSQPCSTFPPMHHCRWGMVAASDRRDEYPMGGINIVKVKVCSMMWAFIRPTLGLSQKTRALSRFWPMIWYCRCKTHVKWNTFLCSHALQSFKRSYSWFLRLVHAIIRPSFARKCTSIMFGVFSKAGQTNWFCWRKSSMLQIDHLLLSAFSFAYSQLSRTQSGATRKQTI